jgi:hypothetical protein
MDVANTAHRYRLLLEEVKRRMTVAGTWAGLPGLMDELHSLRRQYEDSLGRGASAT